MTVLSAREARIFACLADTVLAPTPPLPPVDRTDAVEAFDAWLAAGPRLTRLGVRAALLALEAAPRLTRARRRWRALPPAARLDVLHRIERAGGRPLVEALRAAAAVSYYGDPRVSVLAGYEPGSYATR
jgi:hypothetical protein